MSNAPKDATDDEVLRRLSRAAVVPSMIGGIVAFMPPPRVFAAAASDLVQLMVLLGAATIPLMIVVITLDPSIGVGVDESSVERIQKRLDRMLQNCVLIFSYCVVSAFSLVAGKMVCLWFDGNAWSEVVIDRIFAGVSGVIVGATLGISFQMLQAYAEAHKYRNFLFWVRAAVARNRTGQ